MTRCSKLRARRVGGAIEAGLSIRYSALDFQDPIAAGPSHAPLWFKKKTRCTEVHHVSRSRGLLGWDFCAPQGFLRPTTLFAQKKRPYGVDFASRTDGRDTFAASRRVFDALSRPAEPEASRSAVPFVPVFPTDGIFALHRPYTGPQCIATGFRLPATLPRCLHRIESDVAPRVLHQYPESTDS